MYLALYFQLKEEIDTLIKQIKKTANSQPTAQLLIQRLNGPERYFAMTVDKLNRIAPATSEPDERAHVTKEFRQAAREETKKLAELTGLDLNAWGDHHTINYPAEERS